jgi:hypothetical protein
MVFHFEQEDLLFDPLLELSNADLRDPVACEMRHVRHIHYLFGPCAVDLVGRVKDPGIVIR